VESISGSKLLTLSAGTYTLSLKASVDGDDTNVGAANTAPGNMIVQIIPQ
jgi:hypothetical protein